MQPTQHQKEVLDGIFDAFKTNNTVLLKGCAGTGKTFLVNLFTNKYNTEVLQNRGRKKIFLTAPTNKAVFVLKSKATKPSYNIFYQTIHKTLSIKRFIDDNGEIFFKRSLGKRDPLENCVLLVIDESSMLDSFLLQSVLELNIKVLFVGDYRQLNPVGEEDSPVFNLDIPTFELVEIVRQGEKNPIIDLSYNLYRLKTGLGNMLGDKGYYFSNDFQEIINLALQDPLKNRVLAWTNVAVNSFNKIVREKLYGTNASKIELGEYIVLTEPYDDMWTNFEIKVESLKVETKDFQITPTWKVKFTYYVINNDILAIHEDSEKDFTKTLREVKKMCKDKKLNWKVYLGLFETFIRFSYLYAITVHKSQGSTYETAIINYKDMCLNSNKKERDRLLYTAITRASDRVLIYNKN